MSYTDNPARDWDRHCERQDRQAKRLPRCSYCKGHIYDDCFYEINDDFVCEECLNEHFARNTADYFD